MNIEPHVASLELSKELEKYVKLDTCFYWVGNGFEPNVMWEVGSLEDFGNIKPTDKQVFPAPLASEISDIIVGRLQIDRYINSGSEWGIFWRENMHMVCNTHKEYSSTEVEGYAKMLIYLYENKLIKENK